MSPWERFTNGLGLELGPTRGASFLQCACVSLVKYPAWKVEGFKARSKLVPRMFFFQIFFPGKRK